MLLTPLGSRLQLNTIQQQYREALKTSLKIQEASHKAMFQRFQEMDMGTATGPTHAEELQASLKELLLDDDSDDHKLLVQVCSINLLQAVRVADSRHFQYLKATSKNPTLQNASKKASHTPMIVVESSELKRLTELCRVLAVDLNSIQDQEDYHLGRVQDLDTNTSITSLKIRSNDINIAGSQALTNMFETRHNFHLQSPKYKLKNHYRSGC